MMDEHGLSTWRFIGTTTTGQTVDVDGDLIALKDSYRKNRT
ncbi:hypothetical protein [Agrobacterium rosae]|nr:hypothetical protein [Agrobacterium rosae]